MIFIDKIGIEDHNKHHIDHIEIVFYCFIDFVEWKKPRTQPIACFIGLAAGNSFWTGIIRVNCVCAICTCITKKAACRRDVQLNASRRRASSDEHA